MRMRRVSSDSCAVVTGGACSDGARRGAETLSEAARKMRVVAGVGNIAERLTSLHQRAAFDQMPRMIQICSDRMSPRAGRARWCALVRTIRRDRLTTPAVEPPRFRSWQPRSLAGSLASGQPTDVDCSTISARTRSLVYRPWTGRRTTSRTRPGSGESPPRSR